jgi:hypothetical protein
MSGLNYLPATYTLSPLRLVKYDHKIYAMAM